MSKSLEEFDYFSTTTAPALLDDGPAETETNKIRPKTQKNVLKQSLRTVLAWTALVLWLSVVWDHRFWLIYSLKPQSSAIELGDVATVPLGTIPHNHFVTLSGVIGQRGIGQKSVLGFSFKRRESWYLELLGGQGTFIQVKRDPKNFSAYTQVKVSGRAVDPNREKLFETFIESFEKEFRPLNRPNLRIIQVDVTPGYQFGVSLLVLLFSLGLGLSAIWSSRRSFKAIKAWRVAT